MDLPDGEIQRLYAVDDAEQIRLDGVTSSLKSSRILQMSIRGIRGRLELYSVLTTRRLSILILV